MRTPRIRMPGRTWISVAAIVVILAIIAVITVVVRSGSESAAAVRTEDAVMTFPESPDSSATVSIDTTVYVPDVTPAPAVILAHGFGGDKESVAGQARDLAGRGFVVLAYSARGFGASTGSIGLNDPDREIADARGLVDYLATRSDVISDAPGDPRVGIAGGSYGGALALMAAGTDPRIDADAASITWNDLSRSLFPNNAAPADEPAPQDSTPAVSTLSDDGVLKRSWAGIFFGAGAAPSGAAPSGAAPSDSAPSDSAPSTDPTSACGRFALQACLAYAESAVSGEPSAATSEYLRSHSPVSFASNITAPTLLMQGQRDSLFGLDQADATARQIADAGGTVEVQWFDGGHDAGGTTADADAAVGDFLVAHLVDGANPGDAQPFTYSLSGDPTDQGDRAETMTADSYPGLGGTDAAPTENFTLAPASGSSTQTIIRPPGASPSAVSSLPGLGSALSALSTAAGASGAAGAALASDIPGQSASFTTEPLSSSYTITGTSTVSVTVGPTASASGTVLFAKLYDVSDDGRKTLPNGLISAFRVPASDTESTVRVTLPGVAYQVAAGHRIEVAFSTTDQAYAVPLEPAAVSVTLADATLALPSVPARSEGSSFPVVPVAGIAALALLVAGLVVVTAVRARRKTVAEVDDTLLDVPLVITDLAKNYSNGFRAVDGVSFTVGAGQVLGLLGPNGAGKTTTLRMLMGLISPTSGDIRVFGHAVTPGAPVLSRLGSFVEGSGFLPHLSGMENLQLYWKATGRPEADAHLEEALEIADLGTAIERKVRSYSQGMRQRLAIAQAMLGLPDLMVLDEPTNGLDPPQIRTMRDVLIRYARTGRTVLVSSHLLAEVEQTCTHVVVMNKGSVISSGTVDELIGASGPTEFRTDRGDETLAILRGIDGVGDVIEVEPGGPIRAQLGAVDTSVAVRRLVEAGIAVDSVSRSTRLEDVFLDLVHEDTRDRDDAQSASTPDGVPS